MITVKVNGREVPVTEMSEEEIETMRKNMNLDGEPPVDTGKEEENSERGKGTQKA